MSCTFDAQTDQYYSVGIAEYAKKHLRGIGIW